MTTWGNLYLGHNPVTTWMSYFPLPVVEAMNARILPYTAVSVAAELVNILLISAEVAIAFAVSLQFLVLLVNFTFTPFVDAIKNFLYEEHE